MQVDEGGSKRKSTTDLNIVPFIDLMSVCIIFLLITAVWTQVSMIQIGSSIYSKKNSDEQPKPPDDMVKIPFRVDVRADGFHVVIGRQQMSFAKVGGKYDQAKLIGELKKIKELYPEKNDVVITMQDDLAYEFLITGMDALLISGFPEISVATAGAM